MSKEKNRPNKIQILKVLVGSVAHGLSDEDSDKDIRSVYISPSNRSGIYFRCRACGYCMHADRVGAMNIASRQPIPAVTAGMPDVVYPHRDGLPDTAPNLRIARNGNGLRALIT